MKEEFINCIKITINYKKDTAKRYVFDLVNHTF